MKELLEDMLLVLNNIPNRKLRGKDWTTYDLAKRVEQELEFGKEARVLDFAFRWFDSEYPNTKLQLLNNEKTVS